MMTKMNFCNLFSDIHGSNAAFFNLLYTIRAKIKPETKTAQPNTKGYGYPVVHVYKQEGISINPSESQRWKMQFCAPKKQKRYLLRTPQILTRRRKKEMERTPNSLARLHQHRTARGLNRNQ